MLKNALEHKSGMIVSDDVVHNPDQQSRKKNSEEKTSLLDESKILVRAVEVLRQVLFVRFGVRASKENPKP